MKHKKKYKPKLSPKANKLFCKAYNDALVVTAGGDLAEEYEPIKNKKK